MKPLAFPLSSAADPARVRAVLVLHDEVVRMRARRLLFVHAAAALSLVAWLLQHLLPSAQVTDVVEGFWGSSVLVSLAIGAGELRCYRLRARALERLQESEPVVEVAR